MSEQNELWIAIKDAKMIEIIEIIANLNYDKQHRMFTKNRKLSSDGLDEKLAEFSEMVFLKYPWIKKYDIHQVAKRNNTIEYSIVVRELKQEDLSTISLERL